MATTSRSLEVTIISGENLRVDRTRPVKKNAFVVVRTDSSPISQSTNLAIDGGSYPTWNQTLLVDMPVHARFLNVDVQCRSNSGDKIVGTVRIPASDFAGGYFPENYLHFLSYRLRDSGGERNGIVNLSVSEGSRRFWKSCGRILCFHFVLAVAAVDGGSGRREGFWWDFLRRSGLV